MLASLRNPDLTREWMARTGGSQLRSAELNRMRRLTEREAATAEGVETEHQREMLQKLGCTEMQGYLFSKPRPASEVRMLLSKTLCIAAA